MRNLFGKLLEFSKDFAHFVHLQVSPAAQEREYQKMMAEDAQEREEWDRRRQAAEQEAERLGNEEAALRERANYDAAMRLTEGGVKPTAITVKKDPDGNARHDRIVTLHEVPYYLPSGEKKICTVEIDRARGFDDMDDESAARSNAVQAFHVYSEEVKGLHNFIASDGEKDPRCVTAWNAALDTANKEGIAVSDRKAVIQAMHKFDI